MKFIDYVKIRVEAGNGGSGCLAFHREKFISKGGPSGGDGGRGASVMIKADAQLHTLQDLQYHKSYKADRGNHGEGGNRHGKSGKDIEILVPVGTIIKNRETGDIIADLQLDGESIIVAKGGRGGRGNARFKSPTNQAPRRIEEGKPGEAFDIDLELKVLADVGLVGFPNAGKSTLLSVVSRAKPEIADYPFTTLTPNLGIVKSGPFRSFVMADIPGLIEGAHEGKGLGHQFLRHVERCSVLLFLIDGNDEDPTASYKALLHEIDKHEASLLKRKRIVAITKTDSFQDVPNIELDEGAELFAISSHAKIGLEKLIFRIQDIIDE
jgi:GTPase